MKIKKLVILTAAGLASSSILANGSGMYNTPIPMMTSDTGVYIEGMAGYNRYAFKDGYGNTIQPVVNATLESRDWSNGIGNWAFAAAIGYQLQRYFSGELGGIYTLRAKYHYIYTGVPAQDLNIKLRPWYVYLAGKLSIPIYENLSIFTKLGFGYQKVNISGGNDMTFSNQSNWGAMFGAGLAYNFTPAFYLMGEWLRFTGRIKNAVLETTAPNIFLLGLGYKFFI